MLDKKDQENYELQYKLKKFGNEAKSFDEAKRQVAQMRRQSEELKANLRSMRDQIEKLKKKEESLENEKESLNEQLKRKSGLSKTLKGLAEDPTYSDCVVSCGPHKFQAHKSILTLRSEKLKHLISPNANQVVNDKKNKNNQYINTNTIDLSELVEPAVFLSLMNYLYTCEIEGGISERNVQNLMKAAEKLELNDLKVDCLAFMENKINPITVVPVLIQAYQVENEKLIGKCIRFIQAKEIDLEKSHDWKTFKTESPQLALQIYEKFLREQTALLRQSNNLESTTLTTSRQDRSNQSKPSRDD